MKLIREVEELYLFLRDNNIDLLKFGNLLVSKKLDNKFMYLYKKIYNDYNNDSINAKEVDQNIFEILFSKKSTQENLINVKIIKNLEDISHYVIFKELISPSGFLCSKFPSLNPFYIEKDNLFQINPFTILSSALKYEDNVIYTKMTYPLVDFFMYYSQKHLTKLNIGISLTSHITNINYYRKYLYEERTFGKPFSIESFKNIFNKLYGEYKLFAKNEREQLLNRVFYVPVDRLEYVFNPKTREDKISLSIAEIIDITKNNNSKLNNYLYYDYDNNIKYVMIKYLHALFDNKKGKFDHLDCSLLFYNLDSYNNRLSQHLQNKTVDTDYKSKLFRIDGEIEFDDFSKLASSFFFHDPLIEEFLNGQ